MRLAYIAGPYRGKTKEEVEENIAAARAVGRWIARKGYMPVIPHANTALFDYTSPDLPDEFWLDGTMELLKKCDIVVLCPGWENSSGTIKERKWALDNGMNVYHTTYEVPFA